MTAYYSTRDERLLAEKRMRTETATNSTIIAQIAPDPLEPRSDLPDPLEAERIWKLPEQSAEEWR